MIARPKRIETAMVIADDPEIWAFLTWKLGNLYPVLPCNSFTYAIKIAECAKPDVIVASAPTQKEQLPMDLEDFSTNPSVSSTPFILISNFEPPELLAV